MTITLEELARLKEKHGCGFRAGGRHCGRCHYCDALQPCDATRLIEALEASQEMHVEDVRELQAEVARLRALLATAVEALDKYAEPFWPDRPWEREEGTP